MQVLEEGAQQAPGAPAQTLFLAGLGDRPAGVLSLLLRGGVRLPAGLLHERHQPRHPAVPGQCRGWVLGGQLPAKRLGVRTELRAGGLCKVGSGAVQGGLGGAGESPLPGFLPGTLPPMGSSEDGAQAGDFPGVSTPWQLGGMPHGGTRSRTRGRGSVVPMHPPCAQAAAEAPWREAAAQSPSAGLSIFRTGKL